MGVVRHGTVGGRVAGSASGTDFSVGATVRWSPEADLGCARPSPAVEAVGWGDCPVRPVLAGGTILCFRDIAALSVSARAR